MVDNWGVKVSDALTKGQEALQTGRWQEARAAFERVLRQDHETADALAGMRDALFWLGESRRSVEYGERAYAVYRRHGDVFSAALSAFWLCMLYEACLGNRPAARGWLARCESLLAGVESGPLDGWLNVGRAMFTTDAARSREMLEQALACARDMGDVDLELCALAELGVVLVKLGEVEQGLRCADEAMAGALAGEGTLLDTVVMTGCSVLAACDLVGDIDRAVQWTRAADEFTRTYGAPYLYGNCRMVYARLLVITGRWLEAERELVAGLSATRDVFPGMYNRLTATLAELRLRQGRLDEAQALIDGAGAPVETALPAAALALRQGEPSVALRLIDRWLTCEEDPVSPPIHSGGIGASIEMASALCLKAEASLATGDFKVATEAAEYLSRLAPAGPATNATSAKSGGRLVAAHVARARGRIAAARGCGAAAASYFEEALKQFARAALPLETAQCRLDLARALAETQPQVAIAEARAALFALDRLGASAEADAAAALLRSWGVSGRTGPRAAGLLTRREQEILGLLAAGLSNREIGERLYISPKTAAHHVSNVLAKLGLRNRSEAGAYAAAMGREQ
jgi:DNA-binding CsgD family transcriptional regulator